jgi:hypothetical protein
MYISTVFFVLFNHLITNLIYYLLQTAETSVIILTESFIYCICMIFYQ